MEYLHSSLLESAVKVYHLLMFCDSACNLFPDCSSFSRAVAITHAFLSPRHVRCYLPDTTAVSHTGQPAEDGGSSDSSVDSPLSTNTNGHKTDQDVCTEKGAAIHGNGAFVE